MQTIIDAALGANGSVHLQFLIFAILGMSVAWILARPCVWGSWLTTLLVIGVSGAWLGGEAACLIGQADRGGAAQVGAAMAGAGLLAYAWRWLHPRPQAAGDIAIPHSRA
jgi:hypothetical protein